MDEFLLSQAQRLYQKFLDRPMTKFIQNGWTDVSGNLTTSIISEKLISNKYSSLFDFYLDVRLILEPHDFTTDSIAFTNVVLSELTQWFINKIYNLPRTKAEHDFIKVKKLTKKINYIFKAMIIKLDNNVPDSSLQSNNEDKLPFVSSKVSPQVGQKKIEHLQQGVDHLKTPEELQAVLKILQKHIPHITLAPNVVIEGRFITKSCANELRDYLNSVNA